MIENKQEIIDKYLRDTNETVEINIFDLLSNEEKSKHSDEVAEHYENNKESEITYSDIKRKEELNERYIAIKCKNGHMYKLDTESDDFENEIKMQCPYCTKKVNRHQYDLFDETDKLQTLIDTFPKIFGFLGKSELYLDGAKITPSEINWFSEEQIVIELNEKSLYGQDKYTKEYCREYLMEKKTIQAVVIELINKLIRYISIYYVFNDYFKDCIINDNVVTYNKLKYNKYYLFNNAEIYEKPEYIILTKRYMNTYAENDMFNSYIKKKNDKSNMLDCVIDDIDFKNI